MDEPLRPNPDELLASLARPDAASRGRLKVFLGMCPGVGKTFAMLEAAHALARQGVSVLVAVVETHGRPETQALLRGLDVLPRRRLEHRGTTLEEMDLDAVLARKPAVALVDELAHSNAPGSRHPKRHQDVMELVGAGITVFTTLNIQHIESQVEVVRRITGITVQETVPDTVLDAADEVELVDLTPGELRQRLEQGKVYLGARAEAAAGNFFREGNLIALREIALRHTADKVDRELRAFMRARRIKGAWRARERLLVAVGPSPHAESLLRWTRRQAGMMDCPWTALHVDSGSILSEAAKARVADLLALARRLGARVETAVGEDVAEAILRHARENHVTQIVLGKSEERSWRRWFHRTFPERVIRASGEIDVLVVRPDAIARGPSDPGEAPPRHPFPAAEWAGVFGLLAAVTLPCLLLVERTGYFAISLAYLFAVVLAALRLSRGPLLALALLSALCWDYLFITPRFTFSIHSPQDTLMFGLMLVVGLVTGQLTSRLRERERVERERERRTATLLAFTQALATTADVSDALGRAMRMIADLFRARVAVLKRVNPQALAENPEAGSTFLPDAKERAVAAWCFAQGKPAGRFTDTLGHARALHLPLATQALRTGVLMVEPLEDRRLDVRERELLENFAAQLAFALEKDHVLAAMQKAALAERSAELQKTLLDSVSHELKTPLAALRSAAELMESAPTEARRDFLPEIRGATQRLNRVVDHLLDMSRIESGRVTPRPEWCALSEILAGTQSDFSREFPGRGFRLKSDGDRLIRTDPLLLEKALWNVVHNAAVHSPGEVEVATGWEDADLVLRVRDQGAGIPEADLPRVFGKFFRSATARAGGTGLGLSITQGFLRALGGTIQAANAEGGGAVFTLRLPVETRPLDSLPPETSHGHPADH